MIVKVSNVSSGKKLHDSALISNEHKILETEEDAVDQLPGIEQSRQPSMFNSITDMHGTITRNNTRSNSLQLLKNHLHSQGFTKNKLQMK